MKSNREVESNRPRRVRQFYLHGIHPCELTGPGGLCAPLVPGSYGCQVGNEPPSLSRSILWRKPEDCVVNPLFPKDSVDDQGSSEQRQEGFRALAAKHREHAARTLDKELADGHLVLAEGYETLARAIADFDLRHGTGGKAGGNYTA